MPAGLIQRQGHMSLFVHRTTDFGQMEIHTEGVGGGHQILDMDRGGRPADIIGEPPREFLRTTSVPYPEEVEMVTDATLSNSDDPASPATTFTEVQGGSWSRWGIYDRTNHVRKDKPAGGNIAYVDGHVKWRHFQDMRIRYMWGPYQWW